MIDYAPKPPEGAKIRVIGVGGGGCNAVNNMIAKGLRGVELIVANTDKQALDHSPASLKIQLGKESSNGKGAGADPIKGKKAAEESAAEIKEILKGSEMVFVTCGMGGGTGTGATPVIAQIAQEINALVVAIVTRPFLWEQSFRTRYAEMGIEELKQFIDSLIIINNQRLLEIYKDKKVGFLEAFSLVDNVLYDATRSIADIVIKHGYINVDFEDVKTVMKGRGHALMGIGTSSGDKRAYEATIKAIRSPLSDGISIAGAQATLVNISAGSNFGLEEIDEILTTVSQETGPDVNLIHGVVIGSEPSEEVSVTVIATGFDNNENIHVEATKQKPKDIELPFEQATIKPGFRFPQPKNNQEEIYKYRASHIEYDQSPKGFKQLKKYDQPAIERRPPVSPNSISSEVSSLNNHSRIAAQPYNHHDPSNNSVKTA